MCCETSCAGNENTSAYFPRFHARTPRGWVNDPNGMFVDAAGQFHLMYQHNLDEDSSRWGDIGWAHSASPDLVHWKYLGVALAPNRTGWDGGGVWSGSSVFAHGKHTPRLMLTTCVRANDTSSVPPPQRLCAAWPANPRDRLFLKWHKAVDNPIATAPTFGLKPSQWRDPSTPFAWGSKQTMFFTMSGQGHDGRGALFLHTLHEDNKRLSVEYGGILLNASYGDGSLRDSIGVWECGDVIPLEKGDERLVAVKYSEDGVRKDWFVVGKWQGHNDKSPFLSSQPSFVPLNNTHPLGSAYMIDYGTFYASKTVVTAGGERVLIGWVAEEDREEAWDERGWAGMLSFPRLVVADNFRSDLGRVLLPPLPSALASLRAGRRPFFTKENFVLNSTVPFTLPSLLPSRRLEMRVRFVPLAAYSEEGNQFSLDFFVSKDGKVFSSAYVRHVGNNVHLFGVDTRHSVLQVEEKEEKEGKKEKERKHDDDDEKEGEKRYLRDVNGVLPLGEQDKDISVTVLLDGSIVEAFVSDGRAAVTRRIYMDQNQTGFLRLFPFLIDVKVFSFVVFDLS